MIEPMSVLTYLTETQITDAAAEIQGKTLTRPALLATDGHVLVYVVDVDIGAQPIALQNSSFTTTTTDPTTGAVTTVTTVTVVINGTTTTPTTTVITNPPSAPITTVTVTKDAATTADNQSTILRDVPIARNNRELVFADAGAAVTPRRSANGRYRDHQDSRMSSPARTPFLRSTSEISHSVRSSISPTLAARPLTLGELATFSGSFGVTPPGAIGLFKGGVLQEISS